MAEDEPMKEMSFSDSDTLPRAAPVRTALPQIEGVEIECEIGRGGMGVVFRGRQAYLRRLVAVKLLSSIGPGSSPSVVNRFQHEARLLADMSHPNIVTCYTAGQTAEGWWYLVMEYVDGPNLCQLLAQKGPLHCVAALRVTELVAQALAYAHARKVIHRDVKPENILLQSVPASDHLAAAFPYIPKLADLGLARLVDPDATRLTPPNEQRIGALGSPSTMAPEQWTRPDTVDHRADIYGLGCVLFHMLTGRRAFDQGTLSEVVAAKTAGVVPNVRNAAPAVPPAVAALAEEMMATAPEARPSCSDIAIRTQHLASELGAGRIVGESAAPAADAQTRPHLAPSEPSKAQPHASRRATVAALVAVLAAGICIIAFPSLRSQWPSQRRVAAGGTSSGGADPGSLPPRGRKGAVANASPAVVRIEVDSTSATLISEMVRNLAAAGVSVDLKFGSTGRENGSASANGGAQWTLDAATSSGIVARAVADAPVAGSSLPYTIPEQGTWLLSGTVVEADGDAGIALDLGDGSKLQFAVTKQAGDAQYKSEVRRDATPSPDAGNGQAAREVMWSGKKPVSAPARLFILVVNREANFGLGGTPLCTVKLSDSPRRGELFMSGKEAKFSDVAIARSSSP